MSVAVSMPSPGDAARVSRFLAEHLAGTRYGRSALIEPVVAGVVVALGDGADRRWLGKQVVALTAAAGPQGGYAERAVVSEAGLVAVPGDPGLLRQGLSLLHDGPTALTLARNAAIRPGERVLVTGAAGGLGILLVQLALAAGGQVVAAARGERKLELLRSLGAEVVDYSAPQWTQTVRRHGGGTGPDVILDGVGGQIGQDAFGIIAPGGRFSAHGGCCRFLLSPWCAAAGWPGDVRETWGAGGPCWTGPRDNGVD